MDGRGKRQDRLLYWPITSSLDHSTLCYLPLSTSSASRSGLLNRRPGMGHRPQQVCSQWLQAGFDSGLHFLKLFQLEAAQLEAAAPQWGALTDCKLALTLAFTVSNWLNCCGHLHILFHNAHLLLIRSHDLLPLIYTDMSLIDSSVKGQCATISNILQGTSSHGRAKVEWPARTYIQQLIWDVALKTCWKQWTIEKDG